jgi:hypothetical protein
LDVGKPVHHDTTFVPGCHFTDVFLEAAQAADLADARISPSGLGVHFPMLDADLYVPALLEGFLGSRRWMAAQNGRAGGKASSEAKSVAARANGLRGGRPKKTAPVTAEG